MSPATTGRRAFFVTEDTSDESTLWITDGTVDGTRLLQVLRRGWQPPR